MPLFYFCFIFSNIAFASAESPTIMCRPLPVTWPAVLKEGLACGQLPPGTATFVKHTFSPSLLPAKQGCCFIKTWHPWRMLKSSRKIMLLHHDRKRRGSFWVNWDFNRTQEIYVTTCLLQKVIGSRFLSKKTDGHNSLILPVVNQVYEIYLLGDEGHVLKLFMNKLLRAILIHRGIK